MSNYPWGYPDQRLIVGGVDLTTEFQMILIDGFVLNPPEPKFYMIDIPGGNGTIDLTEALGGDVSYKNREQEFTFKLIYPDRFETMKTLVSNFLHGKYFEYQLTWDPGYTYRGRFQVVSYSHIAKAKGKLGEIVIKTTSDPYKYKEDQILYVNGVGGKKVTCVSGRKPVRPIIQSARSVLVYWNGHSIQVPAGTHRLNDVLFHEGGNDIYFNTYSIRNTKWEDLGYGGSNQMTWNDAKNYTWDELQRIKLDVIDPNATDQEIANIIAKYDAKNDPIALINNDEISTLDSSTPINDDGSPKYFANAYTWQQMMDYTWDYCRTNGWTWDGLNSDLSGQGGFDWDGDFSSGTDLYITWEWGDL